MFRKLISDLTHLLALRLPNPEVMFCFYLTAFKTLFRYFWELFLCYNIFEIPWLSSHVAYNIVKSRLIIIHVKYYSLSFSKAFLNCQNLSKRIREQRLLKTPWMKSFFFMRFEASMIIQSLSYNFNTIEEFYVWLVIFWEYIGLLLSVIIGVIFIKDNNLFKCEDKKKSHSIPLKGHIMIVDPI